MTGEDISDTTIFLRSFMEVLHQLVIECSYFAKNMLANIQTPVSSSTIKNVTTDHMYSKLIFDMSETY